MSAYAFDRSSDEAPLDAYSRVVGQVANDVGHAVVRVETTGSNRRAGLGSGVVIAGDGLIVTNSHVVAGARRVKVTFSDGHPTEADVLECLQRIGHETETLAVFDNVVAIVEKVKSFQPDIVFNLTESFHAQRSHEPNIPALLELLKVRYTGAGPDALLLCKDKSLAKKLLTYHRVRVARFIMSPAHRPLKRLKKFVYPAFVKPVGEESSDGIAQASFARDEGEVIERV